MDPQTELHQINQRLQQLEAASRKTRPTARGTWR
jgi:hypothetical protein